MKLKQEYVDSVVGSRSIAKQKDQETVKVLAQTFGSSEQALGNLKQKLFKDNKSTTDAWKSKRTENVALLADLNTLKFEDKKQKLAIRRKTDERDDLQKEFSRLKREEALMKQERQPYDGDEDIERDAPV